MEKQRTGRKVFITGGSGSVGQALVKIFSNNRDQVFFQYNGNSKVAAELQKLPRTRAIQINFLKEFQLPKQKFDIVINNAGINISDRPAHKTVLKDWNTTLLFNVTIPFQIIKQYLPHMIRVAFGRIINISSIYGLQAEEHFLPYTASKHAISGLTKTIAKEYAKNGITCNEICPGPIESEMTRRIGIRNAKIEGKSLERYFQEICEEIPAGRMAYPDEIASAVFFLASNEASYINGISLPIDGGMIC